MLAVNEGFDGCKYKLQTLNIDLVFVFVSNPFIERLFSGLLFAILRPGLPSSLHSMKRLSFWFLPLDEMQIHHRVTP